MSSSPPATEDRSPWYDWYRLRAAVGSWFCSWGILLYASLIWGLLGARVTSRLELDWLAPAVGGTLALLVGITLCRSVMRAPWREPADDLAPPLEHGPEPRRVE